MSHKVGTGERAPSRLPATTRTAWPLSVTTGSSALPTCAKPGSVSSPLAGSATQHCKPCSGSPPMRRSGAVRSECTMPRPAVIQLTSPGRIGTAVPRLSRCMISPSNRKVTVASPICGMRPHVDALAAAELGRPEVIEEDEGADHAALAVGQGAAHREAAEIDAARNDHQLDGVAGRRVAGVGVLVGGEAHGLIL